MKRKLPAKTLFFRDVQLIFLLLPASCLLPVFKTLPLFYFATISLFFKKPPNPLDKHILVISPQGAPWQRPFEERAGQQFHRRSMNIAALARSLEGSR